MNNTFDLQKKFNSTSLEVVQEIAARDLSVYELLALVSAYWQITVYQSPGEWIDMYSPDNDTKKAFLAIFSICVDYEKPC